MRIRRLSVFTFPVPFKVVFRHASASRDRAENLIVAAYGDSGHVGYGEGCPREYVTGETVRTGIGFVQQHADSLVANVRHVADLRTWIAEREDVVNAGPAAFCAVETAILDLLGKASGRPLETLLGLARLQGPFRYSAVLGDAPHLAYRWQLGRYRRQGFTDFKVKLSGDAKRDRRKLLALRGAAKRIRFDANNLWRSADVCVRHLEALPDRPFAVEEPLQQGDLGGFRAVGEALDTRIVLDESLVRAEQLERLPDPRRWILNLRVSKMGGVLRSLATVEAAQRLGIDLIVGCQVGETSILTRAALPVMQAAGNNLIAAEGAFGTRLLARDLTTPSVMFGRGGVLGFEPGAHSAQALPDAAGLGLAVAGDQLLATG